MPNTELLSLQLTVSQPTRLDVALTEAARTEAPLLSRRKIKAVLTDLGSMTLLTPEGRRLQVNASFPLSPGTYIIDEPQLLTLIMQSRFPPLAIPDPRGCFLSVCFESDELLVLDKTSGIPTLPLSGSETGTAVNAAIARCPGLAAVGKGGLEPGLLHRLDTATSGLLAFAKTQAAFERLRALWSSGHVGKIYCARVSASAKRTPLPLAPGTRIDLPLTSDPSSSKRMRTYSQALAAQGAKKLPALTEVLSFEALEDGTHQITVRITTGVRHQIRCHLASMGWPILGDPLYGGAPAPRLYLHSWKLKIEGSEHLLMPDASIEAPIPWDPSTF